MKTVITLSQLPTDGMHVITEGVLTRVFHNLTPVVANEEGETENLFDADLIEVSGQVSYDSLVKGIISDRYPSDRMEAIMLNYQMASLAGSSLSEEKAAEYVDEYKEMQQFRVAAKETAKLVIEKLK